MELIITASKNDFHRKAAEIVTRQVLLKPDSAIGLATGDTTAGIHQWMVRFHRELGVDYSRCKTCNVDEYAGVAADDPCSCRWRINDGLLNHINIPKENTYVPDGLRVPLEREPEVFRETVKNFGGIDLLMLGIGENGHIAFNEPGTPFDSTYRLAPISPGTVKAKAGLFGGADKVPRLGITMGIRDIMTAKSVLLLASGTRKAKITALILNGPVTEDVPASVLRLHPNVIFVMDKEARGE